MPFEPRTRATIEQGLVGRVVARSTLTDVEESGTARAILATTAEEVEFVEQRMRGVRNAYFALIREDVSDADLDDRLEDMPPGFKRRMGASAAAGPVMQVTRANTAGSLVVPAGTTYGRSDNPDLVYTQTEDVTIDPGDATYPPDSATPRIPIVCATRGAVGNAPSGAIDRLISGPSDLLSVTNPVPLGNGLDRETSTQLRRRGLAFLSGLAGVQPAAVLYQALSFESADGVRLTHVALFEDPKRPAYGEVVVDDGSGMQAFIKTGATVSGTIPLNGQTQLWFESPMVDQTKLVVSRNAVAISVDPGSVPPWVVIEERGIIYLDAGVFSPSDTWAVSGYQAYTGVIRELQRLLEGDPSDRFGRPGNRSSGGRVRVVAPTVQEVDVSISLVAEPNVSDLQGLRTAVRDEIIAFLAALGPGEPLLVNKLTCAVQGVEGVRTFQYVPGTVDGDTYPDDARTVLRAHLVEVN